MRGREEPQRAEMIEAAAPKTVDLKEVPPAYRSHCVRAFSKLHQIEGIELEEIDQRLNYEMKWAIGNVTLWRRD